MADNKFETGDQVLWEIKDEDLHKYYPGRERDDGWLQVVQQKINEDWALYQSAIERERATRGLPPLSATTVPPAPLGDPPHELDRFKASLLEVEAVLRRGRKKYPESNWLRQSTAIHVQHALNHLDDLLCAHETGEDHLAHAACRLLMALEKRVGKKDRNDR